MDVLKHPDHTGQASPRWAFMQGFQVTKKDSPYLDRLRIIQTPYFGVYLHRIHRPDGDRDPHDHPWWFCSLVLSGSYTEQIWPYPDDRADGGPDTITSFKVKRPRFSRHVMSRNRAHKITDVDGLLWTLVITGRRHGDWGFWTTDGFKPWHQYLGDISDGDAALWGS